MLLAMLVRAVTELHVLRVGRRRWIACGADAADEARGMVVASMHQHEDKTAMHSPSPSELSA
jgi:hypothetical protein